MNEISYFAIDNENFNEIVKDIPENIKMPYWSGKDGYVSKVKARYLEIKDKSKGSSSITLKNMSIMEALAIWLIKFILNLK